MQVIHQVPCSHRRRRAPAAPAGRVARTRSARSASWRRAFRRWEHCPAAKASAVRPWTRAAGEQPAGRVVRAAWLSDSCFRGLQEGGEQGPSCAGCAVLNSARSQQRLLPAWLHAQPFWYGGSELLPQGRCGRRLLPVRSAAGAGSGTGSSHPSPCATSEPLPPSPQATAELQLVGLIKPAKRRRGDFVQRLVHMPEEAE